MLVSADGRTREMSPVSIISPLQLRLPRSCARGLLAPCDQGAIRSHNDEYATACGSRYCDRGVELGRARRVQARPTGPRRKLLIDTDHRRKENE
jgi:hypothetical protein